MSLLDTFRKSHPLELFYRLALLGVALILLGFALWMTASNLFIINTYSKAYAEVVSSERKGPVAAKGVNNYSVRLKYPVDGRLRTTELGRSYTNYTVGEVIPIYYKHETAYTSIAGDFWGMWFYVLVVAVPGFLFLYFGIKPIKDRSPTVNP